MKQLNGSEDESEEEWAKEKTLVYELVDLLEKTKRQLVEADSYLQASYHCCRDILPECDAASEIIVREALDDILLVAKTLRKGKDVLTNSEVKVWAQYSSASKKKRGNKKKAKKK